ncbi:hypothetical protein DN397_12120 [Bacillus sp. AY1-10]|nr:hypothetical protein DN397_12120 [Bacillus sp. AY1-10]TBX90428.1 hypothetical protein E0M29_14800 [Bacillus cereus]TNP04416.1 hypothetical protein FHY68_12100 [Bacillus pacificus]
MNEFIKRYIKSEINKTFVDWSSSETRGIKTILMIIVIMVESAHKCNFDYVDSQTSNRSYG